MEVKNTNVLFCTESAHQSFGNKLLNGTTSAIAVRVLLKISDSAFVKDGPSSFNMSFQFSFKNKFILSPGTKNICIYDFWISLGVSCV